MACTLCHSPCDAPLLLGDMLRKRDVVSHHYCLLFSPELPQRGSDTEGIQGFMLTDIRKHAKNSMRRMCHYCRRAGAHSRCSATECSKRFHISCAVHAGAILSFFGRFDVHCAEHRPEQRLPERRRTAELCGICMTSVGQLDARTVLCTPCCGHEFHKLCLQKMALSSGYFFTCPICRDKDNRTGFLRHMKKFGVYVPQRDASWETEPNAFAELLGQHSGCDQRYCLHTQGRRHVIDGHRDWGQLLCGSCGSRGAHRACADRPPRLPWYCPDCQPTFSDGPAQRRLTLRQILMSDQRPATALQLPDILPDLSWRKVMQTLDDPRELLRFTWDRTSGIIKVRTRPVQDPKNAGHVLLGVPLQLTRGELRPAVLLDAEERQWAERAARDGRLRLTASHAARLASRDRQRQRAREQARERAASRAADEQTSRAGGGRSADELVRESRPADASRDGDGGKSPLKVAGERDSAPVLEGSPRKSVPSPAEVPCAAEPSQDDGPGKSRPRASVRPKRGVGRPRKIRRPPSGVFAVVAYAGGTASSRDGGSQSGDVPPEEERKEQEQERSGVKTGEKVRYETRRAGPCLLPQGLRVASPVKRRVWGKREREVMQEERQAEQGLEERNALIREMEKGSEIKKKRETKLDRQEIKEETEEIDMEETARDGDEDRQAPTKVETDDQAVAGGECHEACAAEAGEEEGEESLVTEISTVTLQERDAIVSDVEETVVTPRRGGVGKGRRTSSQKRPQSELGLAGSGETSVVALPVEQSRPQVDPAGQEEEEEVSPVLGRVNRGQAVALCRRNPSSGLHLSPRKRLRVVATDDEEDSSEATRPDGKRGQVDLDGAQGEFCLTRLKQDPSGLCRGDLESTGTQECPLRCPEAGPSPATDGSVVTRSSPVKRLRVASSFSEDAPLAARTAAGDAEPGRSCASRTPRRRYGGRSLQLWLLQTDLKNVDDAPRGRRSEWRRLREATSDSAVSEDDMPLSAPLARPSAPHLPQKSSTPAHNSVSEDDMPLSAGLARPSAPHVPQKSSAPAHNLAVSEDDMPLSARLARPSAPHLPQKSSAPARKTRRRRRRKRRGRVVSRWWCPPVSSDSEDDSDGGR